MNHSLLPVEPVLVAGGGIGGLCAALCLAQAGYRALVLEQADTVGEIGAGIQLGPNIFKMFAHLGLTAAIDAVAYYPPAVRMHDVRSGELVVSMPMLDAAGKSNSLATYGYPYGVVYRADLHAVLLRACQALPAITVRTGAQVKAYQQDSAAVTVTLSSGETLRGAALIGADGLWSAIREHIVGDGKPRVSGHIAYRAVLKRSDVPQALWDDNVTLWGGEKTHLVTYPLRRGELLNLVVVFHSAKYDEGWNTFGDMTELAARFEHACPPVKALLAKVETWKMWVLCDREPVKNWTDGKVTLLGDAAHPMLQYLAQGAGQAIEDAVVLGAALEHHAGDFAAAFQAYQSARYLRTGRVQLTARLYGDIYHAAGVTRELRNAMFQSGTESAGFAGLQWMYQGIDLEQLFPKKP